jgi:N-acetylglucosaminyldiphosphoundecaprenol N-acetyl-beta-D-mannosaminyltransferase
VSDAPEDLVGARALPERVRLLDLPLDPLTMRQTVEEVERRIAEGPPGAHVSLNAANVVAARADPQYANDLESSDIVSPDGQWVVWTGRLFGLRIPERVTGIDLMLALVSRAPQRGWRLYLVGARPRVVAEVARRFRGGGATVVGYRDGYFPSGEDQQVAHEVAASGAQLLFVGLPSPRKERFIVRAARASGVPFSIGVGGSFDVVAGRVRRAPPFAQRIGMEWLYRLAQEPRRLLPRYTVDNARYLGIVARELSRRGRRRRRAS